MNRGERLALWHYRLRGYRILGTNVRAAFDYMAYVAPHSGDATVTALLVPQNLPRTSGGPDRGHVAHELGLRIGAGF